MWRGAQLMVLTDTKHPQEIMADTSTLLTAPPKQSCRYTYGSALAQELADGV